MIVANHVTAIVVMAWVFCMGTQICLLLGFSHDVSNSFINKEISFVRSRSTHTAPSTFPRHEGSVNIEVSITHTHTHTHIYIYILDFRDIGFNYITRDL